MIAESQVTIAELEKQQQNVEKPQQTQQSQQAPVQQQPINPMPGGTFGDIFDGTLGTGDGNGAGGKVGDLQ